MNKTNKKFWKKSQASKRTVVALRTVCGCMPLSAWPPADGGPRCLLVSHLQRSWDAGHTLRSLSLLWMLLLSFVVFAVVVFVVRVAALAAWFVRRQPLADILNHNEGNLLLTLSLSHRRNRRAPHPSHVTACVCLGSASFQCNHTSSSVASVLSYVFLNSQFVIVAFSALIHQKIKKKKIMGHDKTLKFPFSICIKN